MKVRVIRSDRSGIPARKTIYQKPEGFYSFLSRIAGKTEFFCKIPTFFAIIFGTWIAFHS